jgi:hypothetical protein
MNNFINRLVSAWRVLTVRRVMLIEAHHDAALDKDAITLWGTMSDKKEQIKVLRTLANSIDADHQAEERVRMTNISTQIN